MRYFFLSASLINLAAISLERAHATFRPFRHRIIKKGVFRFIITIIWVTSGLVPIAIYLHRDSVSRLPIWISFNGFCLFVICISYASIVAKISCEAHPQHHGAASRERKLTKTLFIITAVSLLMWLPYTIFIPLSEIVPFVGNVPCFCRFHRFVFLQTPLSILFYMQSECQSLKELSFHSFAVSKDKLRLFPLVPCDYQWYFLTCSFVIG